MCAPVQRGSTTPLLLVIGCRLIITLSSAHVIQWQTDLFQHFASAVQNGRIAGSVGKKFAKCELDPGQTVYEVTPGMGWDNLRNVEMGRVLQTSYQDCFVSQDGKYLLPNGITLTPIKQSNVDLDSDTFSHFQNYTSITSASINVEGSAQIQDVGISGSYSYEYQSMKGKLVDTKSVITRVSLRHEMYQAIAQPDTPLSDEFRNRLLDLATHLLSDPSNSEAMDADYEADLLVRDFGTHVVTSTMSGAVLSKVDHLEDSFVQSMQSNMHALRHAASASFLDFFKISMSSSVKVSKEEVERYVNHTSHSVVLTVGGPPFSENFTLSAWGEDIVNNLVAIDRRGDPLFFVINTRTLRELPEPVVYKVAKRVEDAVLRYYKANTLRGCMDMRSPNFNENANIDSGDCTLPTNNFTLGGVYQVCSGPDDLCRNLQQRNPATGDFTCSEEYEPVELHYSVNQRCREYCHNEWYFFFTKVVCVTKCIALRTWWCSPRTGATGAPQKGFLLGGMYTSTQSNPVTNDRSCPQNYFGVNFGLQATLCLSADVELGSESQLYFGGFFSCSVGNPLATADGAAGNRSVAVNSKLKRLINQQFLVALNSPNNWPSKCGPGFTQHLAFMENSCEIMYCVRANQLSRLARRHIRRPPFILLDYTSPNRSERVAEIVGPNQELWVRDKTGVWRREYDVAGDRKGQNGGMSKTGVVMLSIFVTLLVVACIVGAVFGVQRGRRAWTRRKYSHLEESTGPSTYQEIGTETA